MRASRGRRSSPARPAQNTDSAKAIALLRQGASNSAGESGTEVRRVYSGTVTDASVKRDMIATLDRTAHSPGVVAASSPYTATGQQQISKDRTTAYATVSFAEGNSDTQTEKAGKLATAPGSGALPVALNGQALSVTSASTPSTEGLGIIAAFVILLLVFRAV
ncbi:MULTISPECIES: MMPL family transporter [unclassified Streptomyces]|uniref:MMPL family transporter n=1 Tax=unclassified Streptomyces TaxID=2593676 RepID=UPI00366393BE